MRAIVMFLVLLLPACSAVQTLPSGDISAMTGENSRRLASYRIVDINATPDLGYRSVGKCIYHEEIRARSKGDLQRDILLELKNFRENIQITKTKIPGHEVVASYLIDKRGNIRGFNEKDPFTGQNITRKNYKDIWKKEIDEMIADNPGLKGRVSILNYFSLIFPIYTVSKFHVGDIVADVFDFEGKVWGHFRFKGFTNVNSQQSYVLQLERHQPQFAGGTWIVYGFSLVSVETLLPTLVVLDAGSQHVFEQKRCDVSRNSLRTSEVLE